MKCYSIFSRLGLGVGGKIRAIYNRLNALAEIDSVDPVLVNLRHSVNQKLVFRELQARGVLHPRVRHLSLFECGIDNGQRPVPEVRFGIPDHDRVEVTERGTIYRQGTAIVHEVRTKPTEHGEVHLHRSFAAGRLAWSGQALDGALVAAQTRSPYGHETLSLLHRGIVLAEIGREAGVFLSGLSYLNGTNYRFEPQFLKGFAQSAFGDDAVVFLDGVTHAYLSAAITVPKVLFLHADHRSPADGTVVPRSRNLIERFDGAAIAVATEAQKRAIGRDLAPQAPVVVIPHIGPNVPDMPPRRDDGGQAPFLCTVSRIDLSGKPIDEAVAAFATVRHLFPGVEYRIYGTGSGVPMLERLIETLAVGDQVRLMGYTDAPLEVFRQAAMAVYPTRSEGFGLSILEALACGCPVVTHDVDFGPRDLVLPGVYGEWVAPGDVAGLADAMVRVFGQRQAYARRCREGLHRFSAEAHVANYRALLARVRGAAGPGEPVNPA